MREFTEVIIQWAASLAGWFTQLEPAAGALLLFGALGALGLLLRQLVLRVSRREPARPDLIISAGETLPVPERGVSILTLTVGNLNTYPVQLLEVAVGTGPRTEAEVAGVNEVLGPGRQLTLDVQLTGLEPRDGSVDVYFYTLIGKWRHYHVRTRLQWQAWSGAHRVVLHEQKTDVARELASEHIEWHRRQSWKKGRRSTRRNASTLTPAGLLPAPSASEGGQAGEAGRIDRLHPEVSDFPVDF